MIKLLAVVLFLSLVAGCSREIVGEGAGGGSDAAPSSAPSASVLAPVCFAPAAPVTCGASSVVPYCRARDANGQAYAGLCDGHGGCCPR